MDLHALACLVFTGGIFALYIWDRIPIATISLATIVLLPLGFSLFPYTGANGPIDPLSFLAGFANPALIAICALMVVGQGLVATGALEPVARRLAQAVAQWPAAALLAVLILSAAASGIVNDTPVVVLLIPMLISAAKRAKTSPARLLMPMNYAVLIGGMATAIGTSTNLIVVQMAGALGVTTLGLFSWFELVAMAALPALLYLWLIAPRLLHHVLVEETAHEALFDAELRVTGDGKLAGRMLHEALSADLQRLPVVAIRRGDVQLAQLPSLRLKRGDILIVRDTAERLKEYEANLQLPLHSVPVPQLPDTVLAQLIITPNSPLRGRSVRQEQIAERFGFVVVGHRPVRPTARTMTRQPYDRELELGDVLLIEGEPDTVREAQNAGLGLLLDGSLTLPRRERATVALAVMALVVLCTATKLLPIALAALGGALALILTRCLSWQEVAQSLSTKVVLLVASSLALGEALQMTGATAWLAGGLADVAGTLPTSWLVALLMALMGLTTNFISNNAAAAIGTPLGFSLAQAVGAPAEPFVLAVLFGCNLCYLTPMGYQTNLLVMNAGGYRFSDFVRVGAPLFLIMWIGLSLGLSWRYGL